VNPEIITNVSNTLLEIAELPPFATGAAIISSYFLLIIIYLPSAIGKFKKKPDE